MKLPLQNREGIVLRSRKSGEGRVVSILTREEGRMSFYVAPGAVKKWGPGALLPFSRLSFSAVLSDDSAVITQYEGHLILDLMQLSLEEMACWYYVIELAESFFPEKQTNRDAYIVLALCLAGGIGRNQVIASFIATVKLLAVAGFDPCADEPEKRYGLKSADAALMRAFRSYDWKKSFPMTISIQSFKRCASYIDWFAAFYGDVSLKMKGAFANAVKSDRIKEK